ncbi:restriction endonuclease subunit S [Cognaticolwellia mytili]|uniref:restriction endonuclease subunit S n=1 Tax=Cognaticolwellia mytili TaxID=1888913 RepID=UPI000A175764|nr:restriction endonuclease subunit S [Cognaticolwellia mytili]
MNFFTNNSSWSLVALKDIATLKRGYDLPINSRIKGDIPIYAANGRNGTHNEAKLAGPGVITGRSGTIGKVHFTESAYWPLNTALYVTNFHGNDPKWVFYMLKAFKLDRFVQGAGVPTLNRNLVHDELIPLPPLDEQKRISAILDKADAIRRKRQQAINLADDFLRSAFLDMFGDPIANNKKWDVTNLGELAPNKGDMVDGPFGSSVNTKTDYIEYGEIPVIRTKNVSLAGEFISKDLKFMTRDKYLTIYRSHVVPGDIVLTKVGTIGNVCIFPEQYKEAVLSTTGSCRIRVDESKINKTYLFYFLKYYRPKMHEIASAGVQPFLNMKHIKGFQVPMPERELQNKFDTLVQKVATSQKLFNKASKEKLFDSLSQKAFAGDL